MVDFRCNGHTMGSVVPATKKLTFTVQVVAEHPLRRVSIICNGELVHDFDVSSEILQATWQDARPLAGNSWYYLRIEDDSPYQDHPHNVCQAVGPLAWSSPIWVESIR